MSLGEDLVKRVCLKFGDYIFERQDATEQLEFVGVTTEKVDQAKEALRAGGPLRRSSLFANHLNS